MIDNNNKLNSADGIEPITPESESDVTVSPQVMQAISQSLIAHYNDIVSEPIPDKFLSLLAELEAKESSNGNGAT